MIKMSFLMLWIFFIIYKMEVTQILQQSKVSVLYIKLDYRFPLN